MPGKQAYPAWGTRKKVSRLLNHQRIPLFLWCLLSAACTFPGSHGAVEDGLHAFPEVRQITFSGPTHVSRGTLLQVMATQPRPLLPPWSRGTPYNPPTVEADLVRLKKWYFDHGFLACTVQLASVQVDPQARTVQIAIHIVEGPPTLVSTVQVTGTLPAALPPLASLLAALPLQPAQRLEREAFERSKAMLLTHLHDAGYARATVVPQTDVDTILHTASVTFTLVPGAATVFGAIRLEGARQVDEGAIRRHLTIRPGQRFSDKALAASVDALYNIGMFQAVTPRALNLDATEAPLDVAFEVVERKPQSLQFGLGYSTTEGFRTEVQWTHRNVQRGAQQVTLAGRLSALEQQGEARLGLPYVLADRTALSATAFVRNEQEIDLNPFGPAFGSKQAAQPAFDLVSGGGEVRVEHRFTESLSGLVGLTLSRNDFRHVNRTALSALEQEIAADNTLFSQALELQWNTSDSLLNPRHGLVLRGRLEQAHTAVVSDVSFIKLWLEDRHYLPLGWRVLLATRLKIGGVYAYHGSVEVPFNVRFFAGGVGSVRGFSRNRLGPQNRDRDPIGGMSLLDGSVEMRFPLLGAVSAVAFADFGQVFRAPFTYHWDALRYAIGPGLRYHTPVGPVRIDVAFLPDRRAGEASLRVELSIGQAF